MCFDLDHAPHKSAGCHIDQLWAEVGSIPCRTVGQYRLEGCVWVASEADAFGLDQGGRQEARPRVPRNLMLTLDQATEEVLPSCGLFIKSVHLYRPAARKSQP